MLVVIAHTSVFVLGRWRINIHKNKKTKSSDSLFEPVASELRLRTSFPFAYRNFNCVDLV